MRAKDSGGGTSHDGAREMRPRLPVPPARWEQKTAKLVHDKIGPVYWPGVLARCIGPVYWPGVQAQCTGPLYRPVVQAIIRVEVAQAHDNCPPPIPRMKTFSDSAKMVRLRRR